MVSRVDNHSKNNDNVDETLKIIGKTIRDNRGSNQRHDPLLLLQEYINDSNRSPVDISDSLRTHRVESDGHADTLLNTAALFHGDNSIVTLLIKHCPSMVTEARTGDYEGQTALHIAIAKRKLDLTKTILESSDVESKQELFKTKAIGARCKNNIMLGELPLSVAVLSYETKCVDLLLEHGARIDELNSNHDSILHSLVKYAAIDVKNSDKVKVMLTYLHKKIKEIQKTQDLGHTESRNQNIQVSVNRMWFVTNKDQMTPLKLAFSNGLINVFNTMMTLKDVFYFEPRITNGLSDSFYYDITEIDHVAQFEYTKREFFEVQSKTWWDEIIWSIGCCKYKASATENLKPKISCRRKYSNSAIEILNRMEMKKAQQFVDSEVITHIITTHWRLYRWYFLIFALVHISVMVLYTTSVYYRKYVSENSMCRNDANTCSTKKMYATVVPWVLMAYSLLLFFSEAYRWTVLRQFWSIKHHHNTLYRLSLLIFAGSLFTDSIIYDIGNDSNDLFSVIVLSGCWFLLFFLKGIDKFCVYIVLFQKIIMGDLFRFGLIILIEFSAYSYVMFIILQGNEKVEEFSTFENTTLTMFNYMLGLENLSFLDDVNSESQRLVAVIYILFMITTYILIINSLIAMMSGTCNYIFKFQNKVAILQKSSVMLFMDGFFIKRRLINDGLKTKRFHKDRFYTAIKVDMMGELLKTKDREDNLTLKDIKYELLSVRQDSGYNREKFDKYFPFIKELVTMKTAQMPTSIEPIQHERDTYASGEEKISQTVRQNCQLEIEDMNEVSV